MAKDDSILTVSSRPRFASYVYYVYVILVIPFPILRSNLCFPTRPLAQSLLYVIFHTANTPPMRLKRHKRVRIDSGRRIKNFRPLWTQ